MKHNFLIVIFLFSSLGFSQSKEKISFHIVFEKNVPAPAVNIIVKNSNPIIGVQTDLNGNAELLGVKKNDVVEIDYSGPISIGLPLTKPVDSISVNLKKGKIIFFSKKKRVETINYIR